MKIQYASDLHLEFSENKTFLELYPLQPIGDILLLAGDIIPFDRKNKAKDFFSYVSDHYKMTYWIPGNHEYYHSDVTKRSGTFKEKIKDNVILINNTAVIHENVKFIFSTMWSNISPASQWIIEKGMSDFHVIRYNEYRFSADHFNELHDECLSFIKKETANSHSGIKIIVTHHVPTFLNYPEKFKGDALNQGFGVELFDFIATSDINYWIFGHHHYNAPEFKIGKTKMLTNQLGYVKYNECLDFDNKRIIEI